MTSVVGRESELRAVEAFLDAPDRRALMIVGEPGIGKTTVWAEAVARARARGVTVLVARPTKAEERFAFAGLADLLTDIPDTLLAQLPSPQRQGLDAALLRASSDRQPGRRVVAAGLLALLRALASDADVVCAVDDLQWLDAPSAAALDFAVRRLAGESVRVVVSVRPDVSPSPLPSVERELQPVSLELGPFSVGALHRVLAQGLGHTFARPTLVRIAQASGGNPLYALEIARELDRRGDGGTSGMPIPEGLDGLVRARVRALPERTRDALLRAAALARPDTDAVDAAALSAAEEAGLVHIEADGHIEFDHPLFASAVYDAASSERRRRVHRAVALLVRDPEERARHLALAASAPDQQLVRELESAARHARSRGAPDTAAQLIELAIRFVPAAAPDLPRLQLSLAEHLHLASDFPAARALLEDLRSGLEAGDLRAQALLDLAEIDYWGVGESAALAIAEEALADARDPLLRARCQVAIAAWAGTVDLPRAAAAAGAARRWLENEGSDPGLLAEALGAEVRADLFLGAGFDREKAMRALSLEQAAPPAAVDTRIAFKLGQWLRYVDDLDGARERLVQAERDAHAEGDDSSLANILLNRVILETWAGNWGEADDLVERMRDAFSQQGLGPEARDLWRAYVDAHAGRVEAVRAAAAEAHADEPVVAALWSRSLGLAELAVGESAAADHHLARSVELLDRVEFREPAIWRIDGDAIEAALAAGENERAERLLVRFEARADRSQIPWCLAVSSRCRALALASRGELDAAAVALERALDEHQRSPVPFALARTLLAQGQVLRRLKRKRQARSALEDARRIFERLGAQPWVSRVDAELRRVAARRAPDQLTESELRIASLAAAGLSNPEIAAQAFVSRKTVEANLARAYRKLGISTRAQLDRALREANVIS